MRRYEPAAPRVERPGGLRGLVLERGVDDHRIQEHHCLHVGLGHVERGARHNRAVALSHDDVAEPVAKGVVAAGAGRAHGADRPLDRQDLGNSGRDVLVEPFQAEQRVDIGWVLLELVDVLVDIARVEIVPGQKDRRAVWVLFLAKESRVEIGVHGAQRGHFVGEGAGTEKFPDFLIKLGGYAGF